MLTPQASMPLTMICVSPGHQPALLVRPTGWQLRACLIKLAVLLLSTHRCEAALPMQAVLPHPRAPAEGQEAEAGPDSWHRLGPREHHVYHAAQVMTLPLMSIQVHASRRWTCMLQQRVASRSLRSRVRAPSAQEQVLAVSPCSLSMAAACRLQRGQRGRACGHADPGPRAQLHPSLSPGTPLTRAVPC